MRKLFGSVAFLFCYTTILAQTDAAGSSQTGNTYVKSFRAPTTSSTFKKYEADAPVADIEKGDWVLDGGLNFHDSWYTISSVKYTTTRLGFHPRIGYFVVDQLELEFGVGYRNTTNKNGSYSVKSNSFDMDAGARYFFFDESHRTNLYAQGMLDLGSSKSGSSKDHYWGWDIEAGPVFFLKPHFAINLGLSYGSRMYKDGYDYTENCFDFCCGFDCYFGPCGHSTPREMSMAKY